MQDDEELVQEVLNAWLIWTLLSCPRFIAVFMLLQAMVFTFAAINYALKVRFPHIPLAA